jgi:folate-dependent phosphoribosylglycinamide formyltransferase PurN
MLFLGDPYGRLSVACLEAVARSGHDVVVGTYGVSTRRIVQGLWTSRRTNGAAFALRRALWLLHCQGRLGLRRLGVPLPGVAWLPELVAAHRLRTLPCPDPNAAAFVERVRRLGFDLIVMAAFTRILKRPLIQAPRLGCVNVHPSLLPRYRGPSPYYWVLANREATSGITVHSVDEGIDTGNVILQRALALRPGETERTLEARASAVAADLLTEALALIAAGRAPSIPQDEAQASYYGRRPADAPRL